MDETSIACTSTPQKRIVQCVNRSRKVWRVIWRS